MKNTFFVVTAALAAGLLAALLSGCDGSTGPGEVNGDAGRSDAVGSDVVKSDAGVTGGKSCRTDDDCGSGLSCTGLVQPTCQPKTVKVTSCPIPTPKYQLPGVSTKPRGGFVVLGSATEAVPSSGCEQLVSSGSNKPTDCTDPVDGFSTGPDQPWCCVNTIISAGETFLYSPILFCLGTGRTLASLVPITASTTVPGNVALCNASGVFVGWACGS